jgi:ABC-type transport system involved in multi-copper enzyme maturation permease subunit
MKFLGIVTLTLRESWAHKTIVGFFVLSTITILLFLFALNLDIVNGMQSTVSLFGKDIPETVPLNRFLIGIQTVLTGSLFTAGLFVSLFATSTLIPSMFQSGQVTLLISKPVSRLTILAGRWTGAIIIVSTQITYLIGTIWIILSAKTGVWNTGFLWSALMIILTYAILFSVMAFVGLFSQNSSLAVMITYFVFFFSSVLEQRDAIYALLTSKWAGWLVDGLYMILPKTAEMGAITMKLTRGMPITNWMPVWSSLLFALVLTGLSGWYFQKKDL